MGGCYFGICVHAPVAYILEMYFRQHHHVMVQNRSTRLSHKC